MYTEIEKLIKELSPKEQSVISLLYGVSGYPKSPEEIAVLFGVKEEQVLQVAKDVEKKYPELISLIKKELQFNTNCVNVVRAFAGEDIFISDNAALGIMNELLSEDSERNKNIIILRFGLKDGKVRTLAEVGKMCGVSRECVRQHAVSAKFKIRSKIKNALKKQNEMLKHIELPDFGSENNQNHAIIRYPVKEANKGTIKRPEDIMTEIEQIFDEYELNCTFLS